MIKLLLFLFSFCLISTCIAQQPSIQWAKCYGYGDQDYAKSIIQTLDGGYIVAGDSYTFYDSTTIDNHGLFDFLIIKLDNQGNIQWQKFYGGSSYDRANTILQTLDSGFIIAGTTSSNDGDITSNIGSLDGWIVKIDSVGLIQWQKTIGGLNEDYISEMKADYDGYIIAGYTTSNDTLVSGNNGLEDYWLTKIDNSGNVLWQKVFGGSSYDEATCVIVTSDSGYAIAGRSRSTDFDVVGNHGFFDCWVLKLDGNGNSIWKKSFGGLQLDEASAILQTDDNGFVVLGTTDSNDGDVSGNYGNSDYWIVKLDSSGNLLWQKCLGGSQNDFGKSICRINNNHFAVAGYSLSNDGDATFCHGDYDYWITEIDSDANIIWQHSFGGSGVDFPYSILQTNDSGLIISGLTKSSNDGDVTGHIGGNCFGDSCSDYWILKLAPLTTFISDKQSSQLSFSINPNPTKAKFTIKLNSVANNILIEIYDVSGVNVYSEKLYGENEYLIDAIFARGIYFVRVNGIVRKLVIY